MPHQIPLTAFRLAALGAICALAGCLSAGAPAGRSGGGADCVAFEPVTVNGATKYTLVGGNADFTVDSLPASACPL